MSTRRIPALSVASTILVLAALSAPAMPVVGAERECSARPAQQEEDCNDLAGCMPDGLTLEGCWTCERHIHEKSSLRHLRLKGEYICTSDDDGSTITIAFDLPLSTLFSALFGGQESCIG